MKTHPYGFRIVGPCTESRRLIKWAAAFAGYASCDDRAQVQKEAYLSAFAFGRDFCEHLESTGSTKGFAGECWSPWIWFDIDREDLEVARRDAARLAIWLHENVVGNDDHLLLFFSGSKGFHVGLPTAIWKPEPSPTFNRVARRLAEGYAETAGVTIDTGVYDKVRAFRAPNSWHPKTGLHKVQLSLDELMHFDVHGIRRIAERPAAFELPEPAFLCDRAARDWRVAEQWCKQKEAAKVQRRNEGVVNRKLNRVTMDFIREGAGQGDRHRLLFSAAADLSEFGCPPALANALLTEAGLDSGLPPSEVKRQIECGLQHGKEAVDG